MNEWLNDLRPEALPLLGVVIGGILTILGTLGAALINSLREHSKLKQERTKLWAEYAFKIMETQIRVSESMKMPSLAPIKIWRKFFRALETYDKTRKWPKDLDQQGLLNIIEFDDKTNGFPAPNGAPDPR